MPSYIANKMITRVLYPGQLLRHIPNPTYVLPCIHIFQLGPDISPVMIFAIQLKICTMQKVSHIIPALMDFCSHWDLFSPVSPGHSDLLETIFQWFVPASISIIARIYSWLFNGSERALIPREQRLFTVTPCLITNLATRMLMYNDPVTMSEEQHSV